jgi:hypothetical protein
MSIGCPPGSPGQRPTVARRNPSWRSAGACSRRDPRGDHGPMRSVTVRTATGLPVRASCRARHLPGVRAHCGEIHLRPGHELALGAQTRPPATNTQSTKTARGKPATARYLPATGTRAWRMRPGLYHRALGDDLTKTAAAWPDQWAASGPTGRPYGECSRGACRKAGFPHRPRLRSPPGTTKRLSATDFAQ